MMYQCGHCGTQFGPYDIPNAYARFGTIRRHGAVLCERCWHDYERLAERLESERETALWEFARYHLDRLIAESAG